MLRVGRAGDIDSDKPKGEGAKQSVSTPYTPDSSIVCHMQAMLRCSTCTLPPPRVAVLPNMVPLTKLSLPTEETNTPPPWVHETSRTR